MVFVLMDLAGRNLIFLQFFFVIVKTLILCPCFNGYAEVALFQKNSLRMELRTLSVSY